MKREEMLTLIQDVLWANVPELDDVDAQQLADKVLHITEKHMSPPGYWKTVRVPGTGEVTYKVWAWEPTKG